jgi:hypothetical protein
MLLPGDAFGQPDFVGFRSIFGSEEILGSGMVILGLLRIGGLIVNGARKNVTPHIRMFSAACGCLIFFGVSYCYMLSGIVAPWIAIYPPFVLCELINAYRAAHDVGRAMDEIIKFASSLSPPAAIAFAAVSAVLIWITRLGILEGRRNDPGKDVPAAQVAAVIVDPTALNRLSDQAAALNATLKDLCEIARKRRGWTRSWQRSSIGFAKRCEFSGSLSGAGTDPHR